jgi:hypothetical protein
MTMKVITGLRCPFCGKHYPPNLPREEISGDLFQCWGCGRYFKVPPGCKSVLQTGVKISLFLSFLAFIGSFLLLLLLIKHLFELDPARHENLMLVLAALGALSISVFVFFKTWRRWGTSFYVKEMFIAGEKMMPGMPKPSAWGEFWADVGNFLDRLFYNLFFK